MNNWHLCFNATRGFYCSTTSSCDVICSSHEKTGYKKQEAKVESLGIEIIIKSNFGYSSKSYLYAQILLNGKYLFNFEDLGSLYILNGFDPLRFDVRPVETEWNTLFSKVANICNNKLLINTDTIRAYFTELNKMIDASEFDVYSYVKGKISTWDSPILVLGHTSRQIKSIIEAMESTAYNFEFVNSQLIETCKLFLQRFKLEFNGLSLADERAERIMENLFTIYEFMHRQNCATDFITTLMK